MSATPSSTRKLLLLLALSAAINVLMLVPTIYFLQVFDRVLVSENTWTLFGLSAIALYLWGLLALGDRLRVQSCLRWSQQAEQVLFERLALTQDRAPTSLNQRYRQGRAWPQLLSSNTFVALLDLPFAGVFLFALYALHPTLAGFGLIMYGVQLLLAWIQHTLTRSPIAQSQKLTFAVQDELARITQTSANLFSHGSLTRVMSLWRQREQAQLEHAQHAQTRTTAVQGLSKWVRQGQQALSLSIAALLAIQGEISVASMIAANAFMSRALGPVDQLIQGWKTVREAWLARPIWRASPASSPTHATTMSTSQTSPVLLEVTGLSATSSSLNEPILSNIQASFLPGTTTLVIGPSGSGKSTLARALIGIEQHLDVVGTWSLNDQSFATAPAALHGPAMGYLAQEPMLFPVSVAENIARLSEPKTQAIVEMTQLLGIHETILALPQGYDTPTESPSHQLSNGLRQGIALARALYERPKLLVLDEPEAHLDGVQRQGLANALKRMKAQGSTVILISHDKSWLADADRLLVLERGEVSASGPKSGVLQSIRDHRSPTLPPERPAQ